MIARLGGKLLELTGSVALIDVGGVGYEVEVTTSAIAQLTANPQQAVVFTHLSTRDDGQTLFGFATVAERDLFRSLIKVSGVGPKLGLTLLSAVTPADFARAVTSGDVATITRVPGIGKKTASRLVMELRDRVDGVTAGATPSIDRSSAQEAVLALVALGYREQAAGQVVNELAAAHKDAPTEDLVRDALRRLAA